MRRAQRRKYHYIYKTTCKITNRYYYGMHSTDSLNDGYIGSGKRLWYSINKYGYENHSCEKLEFFKTREKLKEREKEIVNENLINDPLCMNIQLGGGGGLSSDEHAKKFYKAGVKRLNEIMWIENREKYSKIVSEENRRRWKDPVQRKKLVQNLDWTGKYHTEETKQKMREADRSGKKNSQWKTKWINNGIISKKIKDTDPLPIGFEFGRIINCSVLYS
jgi:hypothetical protein